MTASVPCRKYTRQAPQSNLPICTVCFDVMRPLGFCSLVLSTPLCPRPLYPWLLHRQSSLSPYWIADRRLGGATEKDTLNPASTRASLDKHKVLISCGIAEIDAIAMLKLAPWATRLRTIPHIDAHHREGWFRLGITPVHEGRSRNGEASP